MNKHLWRLVSVIDSGTVNWERRVMIAFQLSDIDIEPQDKSLPIYKQFAKPPYWWLFVVWSDSFKEICDSLWCDYSINWLASCVWFMYDIDIEDSEYQWKIMKNVVWVHRTASTDTFSWWVDTKVFILSESTTLDQINALWFDNKHLKNSNEYNKLKQEEMKNEEVIF